MAEKNHDIDETDEAQETTAPENGPEFQLAKTIDKGIDTVRDVGKYLAEFIDGSIEQAVGLLEDHLRYIRWERRVRLIERAKKFANEIGLDEPSRKIPLNVISHLLLEGSLEEDDELQDLYARLLVNAANLESGVEIRRAFISMLSEIGHEEVEILEALYEARNLPDVQNGVMGALLPNKIVTSKMRKRDSQSYEPFPTPSKETALALLNLIRIGCVVSTTAFADARASTNWVGLTPLGEEFVIACRNRSKNGNV